MPDKIDQLYDALKADGAVSKSREHFKEYIADDNNRKALYEALKADGAVISNTFEEFDARLHDTTVQAMALNKQPYMQRQQSPVVPTMEPAKNIKEQWEQTYGSVKQPQKQQSSASRGAYPGDKGAFNDLLTDYSPEAVAEGQMGINRRMMRDEIDRVVPKVYEQEARDTFIDKVIEEEAENLGSAAEQQQRRDDDYARKKTANVVQVEELSKSIDEQLAEATRRDEEAARHNEAGKGFWQRLGESMAAQEQANPSAARMVHYGKDVQELNAAKRSLVNAERIIAEADHNAKEGKWESTFVAGLGRGFGQKFSDPSTWDMGVSDLKTNKAIFDALNAWEKGQQLTPSQQALLDAKVVELATMEFFGSDLGRGYKAGQVSGESLSLMIEMMANPIAGAGKGAAKQMAKYALKRWGRKEMNSLLKRALISGAVEGANLAASVPAAIGMTATTGAMRTAAGATERMTRTPQGDYDDEGKLHFTGVDMNEKVDSPLNAYVKEGAANAIDYFTEMMFLPSGGARTGRLLTKVGRTKAGQFGLKQVSNIYNKVSVSNFGKFVSELEKRAQWGGITEETTEEFVSGIGNSLIVGDQSIRGKDGLIWGTSDKDALFSQDNVIDTTLGVGVMSFFFPFMKTAGFGVEKGVLPKVEAYRYKHHVKDLMMKADEKAQRLFGGEDKWSDLRNVLAYGTADEVKDAVKGVLSNNEYSQEQKQAVWDYAVKAQGYRGVETMADQMKEEILDNPVTATAINAMNVYKNAYDNALNPSQRILINMYHNDMAEQIRSTFGEETARRLEADPVGVKVELEESGNLTDDQRQMVSDYVAARAAKDGVTDGIADHADAVAAKKREIWDNRRNNAGGYTQMVLKDDNGEETTVWWHNGVLAVNEDGSIDTENSDQTVTVWDEKAGKSRMVDPKLLTVTTSYNEGEVDASIEYDRRFILESETAQMEGRIAPGTTFPIGNVEAEVIDVSNGMITYQLPNGQKGVMPAEETQAMVDAGMAEQYKIMQEQWKAQRKKAKTFYLGGKEFTVQGKQQAQQAQAPAAEQTSQPEGMVKGAPAEYVPEMQIVIKDENGERPAVVKRVGLDGVWHDGKYTFMETPTGKHVEIEVDGQLQREHIDNLNKKVQGYVAPAVAEEQQGEPAAEVAPEVAPEVALFEQVKSEMGDDARDNIENTYKIKEQRVAERKKALDDAKAAVVKSEFGSKEKATAEGKRDAAQQAYDEAVADLNLWKAVKHLKDQEVLAEKEAKEAAERAEKERRRAEIEAANKAAQERYEAEMARRRAEQEKAKAEAVARAQAEAEEAEQVATYVESLGSTRIAEVMKQPRDKRMAKAREIYGDYFDDNFDYPRDAKELVSHSMPKEKISWGDINGQRGLQSELGSNFTRGVGRNADINGFPNYIAKEGEGLSFGDAVTEIYNSGMNWPQGADEPRFSDGEIRDALLDLFRDSRNEGEFRNYAILNRLKEAERLLSKYEDIQQQAIMDEEIRQRTGLEPAEYDAWIEMMQQKADAVRYMSEEEYNNFINEYYGQQETNDEQPAGSGEESVGAVQGQEGEPAGTEGADTGRAGARGNDRQGSNGSPNQRGEGAAQSDEVDENGLPFIKAADGSTIFGEIREDSGLPAAPIKLSKGYQDEDGKGYGLVHIEANHGEQIRSAGFASVEDFVSYVAQNYDEDNIRVGKHRINGSTSYLIQVTDEHDNTLFIELSRDGSYWNVNSGGIFRKGYANKKETVAKTEPQQPDNAVSGGSSLSAEEGKGIISTEPNGEPSVSGGKDTNNSETDKKNNITASIAAAEQPKDVDYRQQAEQAIADILNGVERGEGVVVSDEMTKAIQKIADMETEAEEKLDAGVEDAEEKARLEAIVSVVEEWLDKNVRMQKAGDELSAPTEAQKALVKALTKQLNGMGIPTHMAVGEGQKMLDEYRELVSLMNEGKKKTASETAKLNSPEGEKAYVTVVSDAESGAKVQKNLDTLAKKYEEKSNSPKNILGDIAKAVGAEQFNSGSNYVTIEAKNGNIVTLRLANHNASTRNFDNNGEPEGVSIVVAGTPNTGIENNGDAHVVEYFYRAQDLRSADGKPLVNIIRSIEQMLYSGEYKDTTGLAQRQEVNADTLHELRMYHGSGADFERFDHSHMGEGEGAQAYGYGTYVTEVEGIGRTYAEMIGMKPNMYYKSNLLKGEVGLTKNTAEEQLAKLIGLQLRAGYTFEEAIYSVKKYIESGISMYGKQKDNDAEAKYQEMEKLIPTLKESDFKIEQPNHILYTVDIPDDNGSNYLEWDGYVSDKQYHMWYEAMKKLGTEGNFTAPEERTPSKDGNSSVSVGFEIKALGNKYTPEAVSKALHSAGFTGIKYPAQYRSGGREDNAKNYVIFDENDLKIIDKIKFFKTEDGEVLGYTLKGEIYIDPRYAKADTPVHEYTHLWVDALEISNPTAFARLADEMKSAEGGKLWEYVRGRYPELEKDNELVKEVFAHYSGKRGRERLEAEMREEMAKANGYVEKATIANMFHKLREILSKFWSMARDLFAGKVDGVEKLTADDFADMALSDLLGGYDPRGESKAINERFNEQLDNFSLDNADKIVFELGTPSKKLLEGGVDDKPIRLYGSKVAKKMMEHGYNAKDLKNLPYAIANPIAVFDGSVPGSHAILTELNINGNNVLVTLTIGKGGNDVDFNIITSVYGKNKNNVIGWINNGKLKYVDKEKALNYLHLSTPIVEASDNSELLSAAKVINNFGTAKNNLQNAENNGIPKPARWQNKQEMEQRRDEIVDMLHQRGFDNVFTSKSTANGNSYYIKVYSNDMSRKLAKIRLSNHSVTNYNRLMDEYHVSPNDSAEKVIKDLFGENDGTMFRTSDELFEQYPTWLSGQTTETEVSGYREIQTREGEKAVSGDWFDGVSAENIADFVGYTPQQVEDMKEHQKHSSRRRFADTIEKLGLTDKVTVVDSIDELEGADKFSERKRRAKGWYDTKNGKIVVVLGNHNSSDDVVKTILHEGVAHHGLRQLFGEYFINFLDNVYANADVSVRQEIAALSKKYHWDVRTATEEYLARLAEDTNFENPEKQSWWTKIKKLFWQMMHQLGLKVGKFDSTLGDNELRYLLWRSYQNLVEPGRYRSFADIANDIAMQSTLKVGNFAEVKPYEQGGEWYEPAKAAEDDGIVFRDFSERDRAIVRDTYERMVSRGAYQFREAMQDSMLGLAKAYQAILGAGKDFHIEDVAGNMNAYLAENRMSSTNGAEQHLYFQEYMKPVLDAIYKLAGNDDKKRQELTDYMMAKHGLERNVKFAQRDAMEAAKHGADFGLAFQTNRNRDYAGLTALTGEADVVNAEGVAQKMVDDYEQNHDTKELWDAVNDANGVTLAKMYISGILSKEGYEQIRDMFDYYIPLRGFDEKTSDEVYGYLTSKDGPWRGGSIMKHAEGRSSKADDPIATMALMADQAILQANRNEMKQKFLTFVLDNPSDLVSVSKLWLQYDAANDEWVPVFPDIEATDTPAEVERKVNAFEQKMEKLAAAQPDMYKSGADAANIPYRVLPENKREHQVLVKRGGETYVLTINGNPRAAQALNGLTNPDIDIEDPTVSDLVKFAEKANRFMSSAYTTRNPDFVASNFLRDTVYTNIMAWVKESPKYATAFHKNWWDNRKALHHCRAFFYLFCQLVSIIHRYTNVYAILNPLAPILMYCGQSSSR